MFIFSINNVVLLCSIYAKKHLQYGYLLNYIQRGRNEHYLRYCEDTGLNTLNNEERHNTYGMEYERVLVYIF